MTRKELTLEALKTGDVAYREVGTALYPVEVVYHSNVLELEDQTDQLKHELSFYQQVPIGEASTNIKCCYCKLPIRSGSSQCPIYTGGVIEEAFTLPEKGE